MTARKIVLILSRACVRAVVLAGLASTARGQHMVIVLCPSEGPCELRRIVALNSDGKNKLRLLKVAPESVSGLVAVRNSRLMKISETPSALIRNTKTGVISTVPWMPVITQVALPANVGKAETVDAAAIWQGGDIEHKELPSVKQYPNLPRN